MFNPIYNLNLNIDFENSLIIHFRGGDSFSKSDPNWWKHPPYYFYKYIIDNSNYANIILVIEDNSNPIIKKLSENYNNVKVVHNDVYIDFAIICNAYYVVDSQSSFTSSALVLNTKIKKLYTSPQMHKYRKNFENVELINYDLEKYNNTIFKSYDEFINHLTMEEDPNKVTI